MLVYHLYNILVIRLTYTLLHALYYLYRLLTDFRLSAGPTDERYVTGGVRTGVTLCDRGEGGQNRPKKALRNS